MPEIYDRLQVEVDRLKAEVEDARLLEEHDREVKTQLRAEVERLRASAAQAEAVMKEVLVDHDERVLLFGKHETQPNRMRVMELVRQFLRGE